MVCATGIRYKSKETYTRGNILTTPEISIRPICLLNTYYRIDYKRKDAQVCDCFTGPTLASAIDYIIEHVDLSFESLLYYTKIKNEITNAHNS